MSDQTKEQGNFKPEYIDVEKVIESKSPRLRKTLPGFIIRYLKRIIHQDDLNDFLSQYGHLTGLPFIEGALKTMNTKLEVIGAENIPKSGKAIIASNHPLGGLDGLALMQTVGNIRKDLIFPVNDILMNLKNLEPLFIPINKHGSNTENIQIINNTFASNRIVCYFPAGLVSRKQNGLIRDLEWKSTFITKARRFNRDIIPTFISGRNTNFFYNLANWRKRLNIKSNIEMLYLVDEFYKHRDKTITITFGKPISYESLDKRKSAQNWATAIHDYIYLLKDNPDLPFETD